MNYQKNKDIIKKRQLEYYHKNKNNIYSSNYLPYRLELQRKYYKEKLDYEPKKYKTKNTGKINNLKFNKNEFIIKFD